VNPPKSCLVFPRRVEQLAAAVFARTPMQPGTKKLLRFLQSWIINTIAVLVAVEILPRHISYDDKIQNLIVASLLLGILNAFVRPILMLIALPLLIFTLGLFTLVINAMLLCFLAWLLPFFHIDAFRWAFVAAIIISFISLILNALTGNSRVVVQRQSRPPDTKDQGPGGNGPVIDV
jgi:putative membrane protein